MIVFYEYLCAINSMLLSKAYIFQFVIVKIIYKDLIIKRLMIKNQL